MDLLGINDSKSVEIIPMKNAILAHSSWYSSHSTRSAPDEFKTADVKTEKVTEPASNPIATPAKAPNTIHPRYARQFEIRFMKGDKDGFFLSA